MQLINEKQKANHAINKHSKLLSVTHELEERNSTVEEKFTDLVQRNNSLQEREKSLSQDLEAVTKYGGKDSRTQILEKQVVALQAEVKRVQTSADISADQTRTLLARKDQKQKEIEQYKLALGEMEKQTNDKLTIGLLTQRLVEVQNRDIESNKLAEEFKLKLSQNQSKLLVLETKLADQLKLQDLQHKKVVSHVQLLSRTICYLRGQYSGAVPLQRQQRLGEAVRALILEKQDLSSKLVQAEKEKGEREVELEHLKSSGSKSLTSVSKVRLSEMRLKREVTQLKQQLTYLEKLVKDYEQTIRELEDENAGVYELLTEQRALDTSISTVQQTTVTVSSTAKQEKQRDNYVLCSRCKDKLGAKEETKPSKLVSLEIEYLNKQLAKKEEKIKSQKEEVDLLKGSLSNSHSKISKLNKDIDKIEEQLAMKNGSNPEDYSAFKKSQASAQQAISVLNDRIEQKDVAIKKYQEMLRDLRSETKLAREKHERELNKLSKEHSFKEQEWLSKYQHLSTELQSLQDVGAMPTPHRRAELEELILEQDKANAMLRDSIFKLRQEISDLKTERLAVQQTYEKEKEKIKAEADRKFKKQNNEIAELNKQNATLLGDNKDLADANKNLRKAKSPRGKSETSKLAEKDAEIAKLKEALVLLRQEMTSLIEERMRENVVPAGANEGDAVKKERDVENLRSKVAKLQKDRDEILKEKTMLATQLATKQNPKQTAEIETLKKQLTIQREKFNKMKSSQDTRPPALLQPKDTQTRIKELERELEAAKKDSSKPPSAVIDAWLDNKKWNKKIENQKKTLEKKDKEIETLSKQNTGMRETIERLDREKLLLNNKLKNSLKLYSKANNKDPKGYTDTQIYTQELKRRIFDLEEENATIKHDMTRDMKNPMEERDSTIVVLRHTISGLERQIQESVGDSDSKLIPLQELRTEQEKKIIELEHDLLSAKLKAEHAHLELPRLRTRVNELQAYTDVLKPASTGRSAPARPVAGKSVVELERVINAMKRVIEKLQKENAQIKSQMDLLHKQNQSELQAKPNDELEELVKNLKQSKEKVKAIQDELDSCTDEKLVLKKEVRELRDSLRDLNKQIEGQIRDAALEKKHSDDTVHLEHKLSEEQAVVTQLRENLAKLEEDNRRKNTLLSEIRRRLTGVAEREGDLEEEIRLLHECKMPNGAKEIAKEAVRLKRQNEKLTEQLQNLTKSTAPGLDPVFFEKLEEIKSDNEVMVRKIVLYKKQLSDLKLRHPDEEIIIDFQGTVE
ncbi:centrosomal protein of 290 kDa-like [Bolinopsis microptera]|uniref:centrosomal protein of 290 kDa-like n=1 Tax=Bolinopsis microptera TaxID=2820187 RepID=UPI003078DCCB